jgi:hypothetical protein
MRAWPPLSMTIYVQCRSFVGCLQSVITRNDLNHLASTKAGAIHPTIEHRPLACGVQCHTVVFKGRQTWMDAQSLMGAQLTGLG